MNKEKEDVLAPIKQRIIQFAEYKGLAKGVFFASIGVSPSNFRSKGLKSEVGGDVIAKISSIYPEINLTWLITGHEEIIAGKGLERKTPLYKETSFKKSIAAESDVKYDNCPDCFHKERLIEQLQKENDRLWNIVGGNNVKNDSTQAS